MQYNTKSFIKLNKGKLSVALFSFLLVLVFPLFMKFKNPAPVAESSKYNGETRLALMLLKAEQNSGFSPDSAEFYSNRLLAMSSKLNQPYYLVRSLVLLGNIKKLKGDPARATLYYVRAAALAETHSFVAVQCEAILNLGEIIYKKGEYNKSLALFLKADSLAVSNRLQSQEACALYFLGKYNQTRGNFTKAKMFYLQSLAIARANRDQKQLVLLLPSLGKYYLSEGKSDEALRCYQEAFYISSRLNDRFSSADICNHLGGIYLDLNEYQKAMDYQRMSLKYRLDMNYPGELAKSYNNIGKIHLSLKQLDSATYYFDKSLRLCRQTDYKKGLVKALTNLGEVNRLDGQLNKASAYFHEAFALAFALGYDNGIAEASVDLGDMFKDKKCIDSAITYYNIALAKFGKTNYHEDLLRVFRGLYAAYLSKSDYRTALLYHESMLESEKKLLDVDNKRQLAIINISFDTERKAQEYTVLLKDHELQASLIERKNTFIWLIILLLGFTVMLCLYVYNRFYMKKKANLELEKLNSTITDQNVQLKHLNQEIESVSKEKDKLFTIISHELRNPLYWLQNLSEALSRKHITMPAEKISKTLLAMDESAKNVYHLMDNLLHWSRSKLNRVHPQKIRHNLYGLISETTRMYETFLAQKEISLFIDLPKDIFILADADLFSCVLRNLVSNAIKYTPQGGKIRIQQQLGNHFVTLMVADSGKGMTGLELKTLFTFKDNISMPGLLQEKGSGLGLKLCKDFVEMNGGTLWADSIQGIGTRFFFTVPLQNPVQIKIEEMEIAESLN